jgi:hypothetical protein
MMLNQTECSLRSGGRRFRFTFRSLLAIVAGTAFIATTVRVLIQLGITPYDIVFLTLPWATASSAGAVASWRFRRSAVLGGVLGGASGAALSYAFDMVITRKLFPWPGYQVLGILAWSVCCGAILAGIMAIVREGISARWLKKNSLDSSSDAKFGG